LERIESAIRAVVEFTEAFNRHDAEGMGRLLSEDCIFEDASLGSEGASLRGKASTTGMLRELFEDRPTVSLGVEEVFGQGSRCVLRWKRGWIEANGSEGRLRGVDIFKVRNGLIYEVLSYIKGCEGHGQGYSPGDKTCHRQR